MLLDLDQTYVIYLLAAASVVLFVEAIYLLCFSTASYRSNVNRRLRRMKKQPNQESILIQLRRERGLTSNGLYGLPVLSLNRLMMQSGLSIAFGRLAVVVAIGGAVVFVAAAWLRGSLFEAGLIALGAVLVLPYAGLSLLRR